MVAYAGIQNEGIFGTIRPFSVCTVSFFISSILPATLFSGAGAPSKTFTVAVAAWIRGNKVGEYIAKPVTENSGLPRVALVESLRGVSALLMRLLQIGEPRTCARVRSVAVTSETCEWWVVRELGSLLLIFLHLPCNLLLLVQEILEDVGLIIKVSIRRDDGDLARLCGQVAAVEWLHRNRSSSPFLSPISVTISSLSTARGREKLEH